MDDLAHELSLNHRKRKARQDDQQDQEPKDARQDRDKILRRPDSSARPAKAPRLSWLSHETTPALWNAPASPQVSTPLTSPSVPAAYPHKSPKFARASRDEVISPPLSPTHQPPLPSKLIASDIVSDRTDSDLDDITVPLKYPQLPPVLDDGPSASTGTPDLASLHIPPMVPLINCHTLKDLDFNEIMHNTCLRHDILFETGLQFRPTGSRRKRDSVEPYWDAVSREIESGCTCVSYDASSRKYIPTACICDCVPLPIDAPFALSLSPSIITVRTPSRIRNLLNEFLDVLLHVIQPLSMLTGPYVNPNFLHAPIPEHATQAEHIRSLFDPELIEQELKHRVFDPSGLFQVIGTTLKAHCAPMRDHAVDSMVEAAQACAPGGSGNTGDAVKVVRTCLEILELMKLDIANHQMQTLRPFLVYTSGSFERKMLRSRRSIEPSLPVTKQWLRSAHNTFVLRPEPIKHPLQPQGLRYTSLGQKQQLYISVVRSIVDLAFNPPPSASSSASSTSPSSSPVTAICNSPLSSFPETLYLDQRRIQTHSSETADITALWMLLLLYRQLATSGSSQGKCQKELLDEFAVLLKREIRAIGPTHLGSCFLMDTDTPPDNSSPTGSNRSQFADKLRSAIDDIVLQVARRATNAQRGQKPSGSTPLSSNEAVDERMVSIARNWAKTNMKPDSALRRLLHGRLREAVFEKVLAEVYPARAEAALEKMMGQEADGPGEVLLSSRDGQVIVLPKPPPPPSVTVVKSVQEQGKGNGLELLADDVRSLVDKISLLVIVHFNAYLPLYEKEEFMHAVL